MKNIQWTPRSISDYQNTLLYLEAEWGQKVRIEFIHRVELIIQLILKYPNLYPPSSKSESIRRCVITKHTTLYYRISKIGIELIAFHDNRKNSKI